MFKTKVSKVAWAVVMMAIIVSVLHITPAYSAEIVDQSYQPASLPGKQVVGNINHVRNEVFQTFVPSVSGSLTAVGFYNYPLTLPTGIESFEAEVVSVNSTGTPTDTSLASVTVSTLEANAWAKVTFPTPIVVTAGNSYALKFSCNRCATGTYYNLGFHATGNYLKGLLWTRNSSNNTISRNPNSDLGFVTYMDVAAENAELNGLELSYGTLEPQFTSTETSYAATFPYSQTSVAVKPIVANQDSSVSINGEWVGSGSFSSPILLDVGRNLITVIVYAQDQSSKTYTISIDRESPAPITITKPVPSEITNQSLPTISGTATSGTVVKLILDGSEIQQVTAQEDGKWSYKLTTPITEGLHQIKAVDVQDSTNEAMVDFIADLNGPTISYTQSPNPIFNWNKTSVTVTFTCSDTISEVYECPQPIQFVNEGANQFEEVRAVDSLGNTTTLTVSNINIDYTNPTVSNNVVGAPNEYGWNNEPVFVNFQCSDSLSGVSFCSAPMFVTYEGANQPVSGIAIDVAGNIGVGNSQNVNLDMTAPTISYTIEGTKSGNWYTSDVKLSFSCNDELSGVVKCPEPVLLTNEGLTAAKAYRVFDRAGNQASVTVGEIRIDKSSPSITANYPSANANGWYTKAFEIQFTCSDNVSDVVQCPAPIQVKDSGKNLSFTRTISDAAGHQASTTVSGLNVDTIAPSAPVLQTTSIANQAISLKWTASTDNMTFKNYELFRDGNKLATTTQLAYQDMNLVSGKTYNYVVVATDEAGNTTFSNVLPVTTTSTNSATIYYRVPGSFNGTSFYHYTPVGGQWTSAPGLLMSKSTYSGFHVITIDLGKFTSMTGVFNSGTGLWDNNAGKNYNFPMGVSTLDNGVVKLGTPGEVDKTAPTVPQNLASSNTGNSSTSLTWSASTDNVNVTGYTILRNGVAIANSLTNSYKDSGLSPGTTYQYSVLAFDAAGNKSAVSNVISVTTSNIMNTLTVYYKVPAAWNGTSFFHFKPSDGVWTTAPGMKMTSTNFNGYNVITVVIDPSKAAQGVFNNGASMWDNNGGKDYLFASGVFTVNGSTITPGTPQLDSVAPSIPADVKVSQATTSSISLSWTASTDNVAVKSYNILRNGSVVGSTTAASFTDTGLLAETTYTYAIVAVDFSGNQSAASLTVSGKTNKGNLTTIYYKVPSGTVSLIHYKPSNGVWTNVPTQMTASEFVGYNVVTIDLGISNSLLAAFNNGAGVWDNNDKKDYFFALGTFTLNGSVITNGPPVADTIAPSVPTGVASSNVRSTDLTLTWTVSTDNVGVKHYEVYRDGVLLGTVTGTSYTDGTVKANTEYTYSVRAVDAAGNKSASSNSVIVKTAAGNTIKIYYKASSNGMTNIHYKPSNGTWTAAPGVKMSASEFAGYNVITLDVGTSTSAIAAFNNGAGVWDNNQSKNYTFPLGVYSVTNGVMKAGTP